MDLRLNGLLRLLALLAVALLACPGLVQAQAVYTENFTGATLQNAWYATGGTCLTAGTLTAAPSSPPTNAIIGCTANLAAYYKLQSSHDSALVGGNTGTFPDAVNSGALRFTNGYPYGGNERGSLVSGFTFPTAQGVSISFNTVTDLGDSGGDGKDGADGISFFLMDACVPLAGTTPPAGCTTNYGAGPYTPIGATGGSLGYSCNNRNSFADGVPGAYLGLGIDEYGNFLNGVSNTLNDPNGYNGPGPDNTIDGGLYDPGRIGLRGAGNVNWQYLNGRYNSDPGSNSTSMPYYPGPCAANTGVYDPVKNFCEACPSGTYSATTHSCPNNGTVKNNTPLSVTEMWQTCSTGYLYNFSNSNNPQKTNIPIADYSAIVGGFTSAKNIGGPIANESAATRGAATPIVYNLQITQDSKLSFQVSYGGGAFKNILTNTDFSKASGTIPNYLRFGFTGATGGSTNIHELMCFQAGPNNLSASGAGNNNFQNPQLIPGEQLFLGSYFPTRAWAGSVTAQSVANVSNGVSNSVVISKTPNWDASCVLTKLTSCPSGAPITSFEAPSVRQILTFDKGTAYYFNYTVLPTDLQNSLDGDDGGTGLRVNFLRGDQTNELSDPTGKGLKVFRTRTSVLGDVIDSTPTLVGPPSTYPSNIIWGDYTEAPTTQQPEGVTGAQTYAAFQSKYQTRTNVVYVGANDGMLHGFRAGSFDSNNNFVNTNNDGYEVLAYMPGAVASTIHNTGTLNLDPTSPQYTHAYFVDATAATGDVFFGTQWHTWVVGGLGAGAIPGIYALDVTDPTAFADPARTLATVIGEWTPRGINGGCANASSCGDSMGNISGVPQIRRFHDGKWGVIFGNGINSTTGDAGIFIMLLDKNSGNPSFLYLSTSRGSTKSPNGIVSASAADIDGDHIVDFVYAGDLQGNVWRFDLTDSNESNWKTSQYSPIFTEPHGLPITTKIAVSTLRRINLTSGYSLSTATREGERIVLGFGTGRMIPQTPTAATQYAAGPHYIYGIWDADMSAWNAGKNGVPVVQPVISFAAGTAVPTLGSPTNLVKQTITTVPGMCKFSP
jgi:type IV pilus assembly protein PilY1